MEENQTAAPVERIPSLPPKITRENFTPPMPPTKAKIMLWTRTTIYTLISSFLVAFAAYSLITPNNFTIGGASGIVILLNVAFDLPQSIVLFCINCPLVILAFVFVKRKFAILSAMNIGGQSLWLVLFENIPKLRDFTIAFDTDGTKIFAALAAGLCIGAAISLAFKVGGSTGGADILAVMIQRKFAATSIAWMLFFINCVIIASSLLVFREDTPAATLLPIMMAAFESYIESKTNDSMTNGFHSAIEFRIITTKPNEMALSLMHELSRGVTAMTAKGMYTQEDKTMLICVISRRQIVSLKRIMKQVDPDAFAVMSKVSQVVGLGFYTPETDEN